MTRLGTILGTCAALVLIGTALSSEAAEDEGAKVYQASCTSCHSAKNRPLDAVRLTRDKWKDEVERMEGLGAQIPKGKQLSDLLDYLAKTHGPDSPAAAPK